MDFNSGFNFSSNFVVVDILSALIVAVFIIIISVCELMLLAKAISNVDIELISSVDLDFDSNFLSAVVRDGINETSDFADVPSIAFDVCTDGGCNLKLEYLTVEAALV